MTPVLFGLAHGLGLLALAALVGGLVLDLAIVPARAPELAASRARLRRLVGASLAVLAVATAAELVLRAQSMSRAPLAESIASLPEIVVRTHLGTVLAMRLAAVALAGLLALAPVAALRALCLLVALGMVLTVSLTGHAADWGDATSSIAVDWIHAGAASVWAGGLLGLAIAVVPWQGAMPAPVLAGIARRFSRVAGLCLVAVIATGIANAWWQLGGGSRLWTTAYGRVLIVKVLVVVGLAWLGAVNRYVVLPRLGGGRTANGLGRRVFRIARLVFRGRRRGDAERAARFWLSAYVKREAALAVLVLACTAALREVTPGRHTAFERRPSSHVTNIVSSPTGGGVRVSGTVTPPAGDAARGRALFVKLGCFACHAVGEERFTAPSRPGPDLTAIGRRHPGYLVESVMNPNARIVDGPGYTDARGLSTMPDYRDRITVGDLIDLVAFLGSLRG